nr:hypothetical protein [Oceanococcus sp. HetDA_MAG_MS8]
MAHPTLDSNNWTSSSQALKTAPLQVLVASVLVLVSHPAIAHGFGQIYTLPVPTWMYLYGAAAALLVSFVIFGFFVSATAPSAHAPPKQQPNSDYTHTPSRAHNRLSAGIGLLLLSITVVTGFMGVSDPYRNLSMTLFWVIFALGYAYWVALFGNRYASWNPWRALCSCITAFAPQAFVGRYRYTLGYWPALALYMGFIWLELLGHGRPSQLAMALSAYTAINLVGAWLWGATAWFRYAEFFGVMLRLLGKISPLSRQVAPNGHRLSWRWPFSGLLGPAPAQTSLLLFILFMLSSTAFDGLKSSMPFVRLYWEELAGVMAAWLPAANIERLRLLKTLYPWWQTAVLWLSPFIYWLIYMGFVWLMRAVTRSAFSLRELALAFAFSLVPIAFVYSLTHYFTLLFTQGPRLINLLSDPFGWGWNIFGTAHWRTQLMLDAGVVWHIQVSLILLGHIVSVYLAHVQALSLFPTRRQAIISQLPMLLLMVIFTVAGLWILSLPISPRAT